MLTNFVCNTEFPSYELRYQVRVQVIFTVNAAKKYSLKRPSLRKRWKSFSLTFSSSVCNWKEESGGVKNFVLLPI